MVCSWTRLSDVLLFVCCFCLSLGSENYEPVSAQQKDPLAEECLAARGEALTVGGGGGRSRVTECVHRPECTLGLELHVPLEQDAPVMRGKNRLAAGPTEI